MISHGKHDPRVFEIHIKTEDCLLKSNLTSEFDVSLDASIVPRPSHFLSVSLASASIPYTWYNFSENLQSNKLAFDDTSFTFQEGNYDIDEICSLLTGEATFPFSCTINYNSAKVTLTNTDNTLHVIKFSEASTQGLVEALGFKETDRQVAAGSSITSDNTINMNVVTALFLYTNLGIDNVISSSNGGNFAPILDKIELFGVSPFGVIQFSSEQTIAFHAKMQITELRNFSLSLRDQKGRLVDLNNRHFELTIHVKEKEVFNEEEVLETLGGKRRRVAADESGFESQEISEDIDSTPTQPTVSRRRETPPVPPFRRSERLSVRNKIVTPTVPSAPTLQKNPRILQKQDHPGSSLSKNTVELQNAMLAAHLLEL